MIISVLFTIFIFMYLAYGVVNTSLEDPEMKHSLITNEDIWGFWLYVLMGFLIFSLIFFILDLNLVIFHLYLHLRGITTYDFVKERKKRKSQMEEARNQRKIVRIFLYPQFH